MDSILDSIKKVVGVENDDTSFDEDLIMHTNTAFMSLNQLGVGTVDMFSISSNVAKWTDFLGEKKDLEAVKSYVSLKVKLIFDPPTSSVVLDSLTRSLNEMESRLMMQADFESHPYNPPVVETEENF